ncbi:hypothetical protein HUK65_13655 [Rhodobacteraceae bacterium 2376]|uniref:Uncharacterized protein n=1 Tax=Rhabdonatronobacter sediminivivens TaxID=2743469 RepID=A0A7Z0I1D4_9RHOB|nr:hypothetical protein [Rhabdonatronobacter sediminivivens]NYS26035.1 hypothetical protein [Rhabdonatronobacter sediminivivens]
MTPLVTDFLVGGMLGGISMLALTRFPRVSYIIFLLALTGLAAIIALEGSAGFIAIVDRAIAELLAAIPEPRLAGLSAGMMLVAMFNTLSSPEPRYPK